MSYSVRLLTPSVKVVPFIELMLDVESIKLVSGTDISWERIDMYNSGGRLISNLERNAIIPGSPAEARLAELKWSVERAYPVSAREWIIQYLSRVKTLYTFQLVTDNITKDSWLVLGRVQNLLKDNLTGIIQADNEGFYNEDGDYILWQMYEGAVGAVPAALLNNNGEWVKFELNLKDNRAVERFKEGIVLPRSFLGKLFGR